MPDEGSDSMGNIVESGMETACFYKMEHSVLNVRKVSG